MQGFAFARVCDDAPHLERAKQFVPDGRHLCGVIHPVIKGDEQMNAPAKTGDSDAGEGFARLNRVEKAVLPPRQLKVGAFRLKNVAFGENFVFAARRCLDEQRFHGTPFQSTPLAKRQSVTEMRALSLGGSASMISTGSNLWSTQLWEY